MKRKVKISRPDAVKKYCFQCSGNSNKEVVLCHIFDCPLWEWRCGNHISTNAYKDRLKTAVKNYIVEFGILFTEFGIMPEHFSTGDFKYSKNFNGIKKEEK